MVQEVTTISIKLIPCLVKITQVVQKLKWGTQAHIHKLHGNSSSFITERG